MMVEQVQLYTWEQVARHNGRNGSRLWTVYKDVVLDITNFENEHPGGSVPLRDEAGKDCTRAFDDVGHSKDAKKMMEKFKIGEIVEEERHYVNGKRVVRPGEESGRGCLSIITCGLLGS